MARNCGRSAPRSGRHQEGPVGAERLANILKPWAVPKMALAVPPPRDSRFGSPLKLSRAHRMRPEMVVEVSYLTWTDDNLLRQASYQGQREDKPARQVVRLIPHPPRRSKEPSRYPGVPKPRETAHGVASGKP
ncbi:ATP dependent DNA ligase [Reyranella soli]|uniref:ATP dependent DNA ligase n=1 Tax=Reyranella soli TaxID=1230389 RepID=UPI0035A226FC